jgi:hypothetical protein
MKSVEVCFKKDVLAREKYKKYAKFLNEIMTDGVAYSLNEVDKALIDYCKGRVGKCAV